MLVRVSMGEEAADACGYLKELLMGNPGIVRDRFEKLAAALGVGRKRAREFLKECERGGTVKIQREGRCCHHFWCAPKEAAVDGPAGVA
jgi:hypothetical protein